MADKIRVATASLCGCFGCHMSLLDIDERILELVQLVEFDRSPINDIKTIGDCDVGLIEGGVANAENVEVLRDFRKHCKVLVAFGACAVNGRIPPAGPAQGYVRRYPAATCGSRNSRTVSRLQP